MKGGIAAILEAVLDTDFNKIKNGIKLYFNNYEIPYTTMNVGILEGGSAKNSIPAECYATLDFRIVELEHTTSILNKIEELCEKYNCRCDIIERIEPFINNVDYENEGETADFMTEASFVDCESKIILGVGPVTAHEVNEYIEGNSYDKLVEQYKELIEKFS